MHVRLGGEQSQRDLAGAEAAQGLERQHQPRFLRHALVAADEQHAQEIVVHLGGEARCHGSLERRVSIVRTFEDARASGVAAQHVEDVVVRGAIQPRARIVGPPALHPHGQRAHQRALHRVLDDLEVLCAEDPGQRRDDASVLVAKKMIDQARGCARTRSIFAGALVAQTVKPIISRISIFEPGMCTMGHSLATATARS